MKVSCKNCTLHCQHEGCNAKNCPDFTPKESAWGGSMTEEQKKEIANAIYNFDSITQSEMREIDAVDLYNLYAVANNQMLDAMQICRERGVEI